MQKITTFLWFNDNAEEAVNFYVSVFANSRVLNFSRRNGAVLTAQFELEGQQFLALNGGPQYRFTEAISLLVNCETQEEVDSLWSRFCEGGGEAGRCGWLKDKFGLSWQIIPSALGRLLTGGDAEQSKRVMEAMMRMNKIDIGILQKAYSGESS